MNVTPLGHRVLVRPQKLEEHDDVYASAKKFGIALLESNERQERSAIDKGIVLAIGDTAFKDYGGGPWCKVGDLVAYAKHSGKFINNGEEELLVLNDEDLVARIGD